VVCVVALRGPSASTKTGAHMNFLLQCYGQRRKTAIDDIAVKPITQFPVSLAEEVSFSRFDID
jgi:hypothetical protein